MQVPVQRRIVAEKVEEHLTVDAYVGRGEGHEREVSRSSALTSKPCPKRNGMKGIPSPPYLVPSQGTGGCGRRVAMLRW